MLAGVICPHLYSLVSNPVGLLIEDAGELHAVTSKKIRTFSEALYDCTLDRESGYVPMKTRVAIEEGEWGRVR